MTLTYNRGVTPTSPAQLPGFLRNELAKIQRAIASVGSGGTFSAFITTLLAAASGTAARSTLGVGIPRADVVLTTAALAAGAEESGVLAMPAITTALLMVTTDRAARVRLYATTAARDADASRAAGDAPTAGTGLLAEFVLDAAGSVPCSPIPLLSSDEAPPVTQVAYLVENDDAALSTVEVTLSVIPLELA